MEPRSYNRPGNELLSRLRRPSPLRPAHRNLAGGCPEDAESDVRLPGFRPRRRAGDPAWLGRCEACWTWTCYPRIKHLKFFICVMRIREATSLIKTCAEKMNARYEKVVFDEWAIVSM